MRFLILILSLGGLFSTAALANEPPATISGQNFESPALYDQYIVARNYPALKLESNFGQLVYESEIVNYQPHKLYNYYKNQICGGIYLYNCLRNIQNLHQYTGLDINQESGLIPESIASIKGYKVYYTSPNVANQAVTMSGAVLVPLSSQRLKGVVVFYHYTVLDKRNIPSNFKGDAFVLSGLTAATLASAGYVVVLPDLPGMGVNGNVPHPYVIYPHTNAQSGIYLLKTLKYLVAESSFAHVQGKIPLFISGYSEGGAYALWAAKILEENPQFLQQNQLRLQKTVPIVGAYNLSQVMLPFMFSNVTSAEQAPYFVSNSWVSAFAKPGFFANTINSYLSYNNKAENSLHKVYNPAFADCLQCDLNNQKLTIPELLQVNANDWLKYDLLFETAKDVDYGNSNNSVQLLADKNLLQNKNFMTALSSADIYNWRANSPVTLLAFEFDSIVPRLSSETAYIAMNRQGSSQVKMITVPNQDFTVAGYVPLSDMEVDHPQGIRFMLPFIRQEFDESLATHD